LYMQRILDGSVCGDRDKEAAIHATGWLYALPMFCVIIPDHTYELLWVHPHLRLRGFGTRFVRHFALHKPSRVRQLPEAFAFWDKCFCDTN
jgi:GNAT superfamily N-acetyltransferase